MDAYFKSAQSAEKVIAKKGGGALRTRNDPSMFDVVAGKELMDNSSSEAITVLVLPPDLGEASYSTGTEQDGTTQLVHAKLLVSGVYSEPAPGDFITLDKGGTCYKVNGVKTLAPAGTPVLYTIGAVKV